MPVLMDHFISHQWLRELKRSGARVLVGVYFRLPSTETIWAGKYNETHRNLPLGEAMREVYSLADPLGYEFFIERKIEASEIIRIRHLPQKIGWRYQPHAHGRKPCGCPACTRGLYGGGRIRQKYDPPAAKVPYEELRRRIMEADDVEILSESLWSLRNKRRRIDPSFLKRLTGLDDIDLLEDLAMTLAFFRHKNTGRMLLELCQHESAIVRGAATESLWEIYQHDAPALLGDLTMDPIVRKVLTEKLLTSQ